MKRKDFLSTLLPFALSARSIAHDFPDTERLNSIPPYLIRGDTIGITSPAGFITAEEIQPAVMKLEEWGFKVQVGNTIGKRAFTFGGTDEERAMDLQAQLDDTNIKAILFARGGYGIVRIIDQINFKPFYQSPKWLIGFSDLTVLHSHVNKNQFVATLHSKMCNSFPTDWTVADPVQRETIESIRQCIVGEKMKYTALPNKFNKDGHTKGVLIGGNLKTLESLSGSKSDISTVNKLLFVEDTGEYLYSIDRMFWNLKRSGKLAKLNGLIVGGFKIKKDDPGEEFGKTLEEIVLEKVTEYKYPVCFDFPVGHQKNNYALKCGVMHTLQVSSSSTLLHEI